MPELTDEEYARRKAEYTAKYGYSITIPGLWDIIKVTTEKPMSALEDYWWTRKEWENFSPERYEEIYRQKQDRKDRYLAMLASPTPALFQNAGSIMTAVDDAQDAISTLGVIGRIGIKVLPKALGKLITGPTGVLLVVSDCLNMVQQTGQMCLMPFAAKKNAQSLKEGSPKMKSGKLRRAAKLRNAIPTKGDWIQALQVTEQVFGFGVSLGPVMGLISDVLWGSVRTVPGKFIDIKLPIPDLREWEIKALRIIKSLTVLWGYDWRTDNDDVLLWSTAHSLAVQGCERITRLWNPLEMVDDVAHLETMAPSPWHTLTKEVINEGPVPMAEVIGWPQTSTLWALIEELMELTQGRAAGNLENFQANNQHSWHGYCCGVTAIQSAFGVLATLEGEDDVEYEDSIAFKAAVTMIENGYQLDPDQAYEKFALFDSFLKDCEETLWQPTMQNIFEFCNSPWNDIKLLAVGFVA